MNAAQLTEDEAALLNDVSDDDYGLWELNSSMVLSMPLLVDAISRGHIRVFAGEFGGEMQELPPEAATRCIEDQASWQYREPPEKVFTVMTSTQGMEALRHWWDQRGTQPL